MIDRRDCPDDLVSEVVVLKGVRHEVIARRGSAQGDVEKLAPRASDDGVGMESQPVVERLTSRVKPAVNDSVGGVCLDPSPGVLVASTWLRTPPRGLITDVRQAGSRKSGREVRCQFISVHSKSGS